MKPATVQIEHREIKPGVAVVALSGKVMLGAGTNAIEELVKELLAKGDRKIVFDLSGVTHIDSTGIGTFIASLGKVMQAGGALAMAGASGVVREGFRVTRLDSVFRFFADVESAAAAL
ncbi:MAG TPA: STAS domain-containing protein [Bryobacteraceae bacterium]|nr:STAS domain-containing protein [Bryobacteraceae bacterium]